jgi:hypothetical protein
VNRQATFAWRFDFRVVEICQLLIANCARRSRAAFRGASLAPLLTRGRFRPPSPSSSMLQPLSAPSARRRFRLLRPGFLATVALLAACGGDDAGGQGGGGGGFFRRGRATDSADGTISIIERTKYSVAALSSPGRIAGTVTFEGAAAADSEVAAPANQAHCGAKVVRRGVARSGRQLGEAVVWLEGITSGKPLPELRRLELDHEGCEWLPRVQGAVAGSTVNLINDDAAIQRTQLLHLGAAKPFLEIPFSDNGQIVPSEAAAREPGVVEVRSVEHPWARAWIASFDHPYFAVTAVDGRFTLDSVPPGSYTLKVWHPRADKVAEQKVEVAAGGVAQATLTVKLK